MTRLLAFLRLWGQLFLGSAVLIAAAVAVSFALIGAAALVVLWATGQITDPWQQFAVFVVLLLIGTGLIAAKAEFL